MLVLAGKAENILQGRQILYENIEKGKGLAKFKELIEAQGGDPLVLEDYSRLPLSSLKREVFAPKSGYIGPMDTEMLGNAFVLTGGGRLKGDEEIDYGAGIIMNVRIGDRIEKGQVLAEIFTEKAEVLGEIERMILSAVEICDNVPEKPKLIKHTVE